MYVIHSFKLKYPGAKYSMPMSNQKYSYGPDTETFQKPYRMDLRSNVNVVLGSLMYTTLVLMHPCAKLGKPMSNPKKGWGGHEFAQTITQKDKQTDRHST